MEIRTFHDLRSKWDRIKNGEQFSAIPKIELNALRAEMIKISSKRGVCEGQTSLFEEDWEIPPIII